MTLTLELRSRTGYQKVSSVIKLNCAKYPVPIIVFFGKYKPLFPIMSNYVATWPIFELKQDIDPHNVHIKFEKNQWRNATSTGFPSDQVTWQEITYHDFDHGVKVTKRTPKSFCCPEVLIVPNIKFVLKEFCLGSQNHFFYYMPLLGNYWCNLACFLTWARLWPKQSVKKCWFYGVYKLLGNLTRNCIPKHFPSLEAWLYQISSLY